MSTPLPRVDEPWLVGSGQSEDGARVPAQIAEKLVGKTFPTFRALREAFWKVVADTPELARQFNETNQRLMRRGYAPYAPEPDGQRAGVRELHHDPEIGRSGPVYDLSTLRILTPSQHDSIHFGRE
jgi:alkanesulfonate monooxygenase SsuD/methylene tetrahydromethanopterin reductase-like flavin-dependent oxidoreductase (luciferase family)